MQLYHGSGKKFTNFSNEYVNTGEEVQKYGYGIYLTDSIEIAKYYADRAAGNGYVYVAKVSNSLNIVNWDESIDPYTVSEMSKQLNGEEVIENIFDEMSELLGMGYSYERFEEMFERVLVDSTDITAWEELEEAVEDEGYDVDKLRNALYNASFQFDRDSLTYETIYDFVSSSIDGVTASKLMIKNGIDGFKFNATEKSGAVNYTIFDSANIKIVGMQHANEVTLEGNMSLKSFIQSHKRDDNKSLIESIMRGYRGIFEGVVYPNDFNPAVFDELPSFAKRMAYANSKLPRISSGSSRIVYEVDNNHVLKLARNPKGIAQNDAENDGYVTSLDSVANVIDASEEGLWLISERVDNIKKREFEQLVGVSFDLFCEGLLKEDARHKNRKYSGPITDEQMEVLYKTELWYEMINLIVNADLIVGDLCRLGSYGKSASGKPVLRDAGFTLTVQHEHYR
jgi:hypothetical protein